MKREPRFSVDMNNPEEVGKAMQVLDKRLEAAELQIDAMHKLVFALVLAMGSHRDREFVSHAEIEIGLAEMSKALVTSGSDTPVSLALFKEMLAAYRGEIGKDVPESFA